MEYWAIGCAFAGGWLWSTACLYRAGWHRSLPWFTKWMVGSAVQSVVILAAGRYPTAAWWQYVWVPLEVLVLCALIGTVTELTAPFATTGAVLVAIALAVSGVRGTWFRCFQEFRGWLWLLSAITLTIWLALLFWLPRRLLPGSYRAAWLLALHCWLHALIAPIVAESALKWLTAQAVFRVLTIMICLRWSAVFRRFPYWFPPVSGGPIGGVVGGGAGVESGSMGTCSRSPAAS